MKDGGMIYGDIAQELNKASYLSMRGKKFTKSIIYTILKNNCNDIKEQSSLVYSDFKVKFVVRTTDEKDW